MTEAVKIKVIGVGGAGVNTVNRMIKNGLTGVEFWVMNADNQILQASDCKNKLQLGKKTLKGISAGGDSSLGEIAAKESEQDIKKALEGADIVFIIAGLGGGTGTGATPVITKIAKNMGILTVVFASIPFSFEGKKREELAKFGLKELQKSANTISVFQNDRLLKTINNQSSLAEAFSIVDENISRVIQSISEEINNPGIIRTEFKQIKELIQNAGYISTGFGQATGKDRAREAAKAALKNLSLAPIPNVTNAIYMIKGSSDMTLQEINEAINIINEGTHNNTNFIVCNKIDDNLQDEMNVAVIVIWKKNDYDKKDIKYRKCFKMQLDFL